MYGEKTNLDISIKASCLEDILKRIPVSFEKVGMEFTPIDGNENQGIVRIRVKTEDANKQLVIMKSVDVQINSPGYLLVDVPWFRQIMGKFGDNLNIKWNYGEQIILQDENGSATKTPLIVEDVPIVDIRKIFPFVNGRINYPEIKDGVVVKNENGSPVMKPAEIYATIPVDDMKKAIQDTVWSKHDYISLHLVPNASFSISGKYDAKGTKSQTVINADVGGSGDIDLPKSIEEFIKVIGKDGTFSIHFTDDEFPAVTMVYEEENEKVFYTVVKMNRPKPGDE